MENIKKLLSTEQCKYVYIKALETLSKIGVQCDHQPTVHELSGKTSIKFKKNRILFDSSQIHQFFDTRKNEIISRQKEELPFTAAGHWNSPYLCDPVTNKPRPASEHEAISMAKLSEALGSKNNPIPVSPGNIPPRLNTLVCERLALKHTRNMGCCLTATDEYEVESIVQMFQIAERRYEMAIEPLISPLRLNSENMDVYYRYRDRKDFDITVFSAIPMAGATAPLALPSSLIMALAEALALDYIFYLLSDGKIDAFGYRLEPFDLRYGNIVFGSPEWILFKQAINEVMAYLTGVVQRGGTFRTTSRNVDGQAIVQASSSFIWQAALGARSFGALGQMCIDQVWSPVMAMLEKEMLLFGERLIKGFDNCWFEKDPIQTITDGIEENNFFTEEGTLNVMHNMYWDSKLFTNENFNTWIDSGGKDSHAKAWEEAQAIIKQHDFLLSEKQRKEIDLVYEKAVTRLI